MTDHWHPGDEPPEDDRTVVVVARGALLAAWHDGTQWRTQLSSSTEQALIGVRAWCEKPPDTMTEGDAP